ncbi:hypothetical protein MU1_46840 [Paenibacillus glycanilyticus]|uniref:Uncharacterized protein n=1 Tax=Paenibacillus glycanilyticus TaxID=126569 RepID=A0ABQ6GLU3_9BACL|nr:hypothetical protein MU1_46840 [Paenibacillus glycanilyticus]
MIFGDIFLQVHWQGQLIHVIFFVHKEASLYLEWLGGTSILTRVGFFLFEHFMNRLKADGALNDSGEAKFMLTK